MRLTKIYTKVGDHGTTLLGNGQKIPKSSIRLDAYGTVDELNSVIGMLADILNQTANAPADLKLKLKQIQNELFDVGGELSMPLATIKLDRQQVVRETQVKRLETEIDAMNESLEPLTNFVLPGGHLANSTAHLARTVCRRAEREVARLAEQEEVRSDVKIYLNRLSDWLFVASRSLSKTFGAAEVLWAQKK